MTAKPLIQLKHVKKSFGENHVLKDINAEIHLGESFVVIGPSGTGKSVLLKCIMGLIKADKPSVIRIHDVDVLKASSDDIKRVYSDIGMLFQGSALFDSLPVWENICFLLLQTGRITREDAVGFAIEKLKSVGLKEHVAQLFPAELSGGMQRRVALARTIASKPKIVFFDEPTAGLDPIMSAMISDLIKVHVQDLGATAITISHDMSCVRHVADRVGMIDHGAFAWIGACKDLDKTDNPYVQQFIHGKAKGPIEL